MLVVKGMRFPIEVILVCFRWYAAYLRIILQWAVGRSGFYHCWERFSESISVRLVKAGGLTRLISRSKALGNTSVALWVEMVKRSISINGQAR